MLIPDVLVDLAKCVSEQRAAEKGFRVMNSRRSLDHLVGTREEAIWHVEAEGLRGLQIDHQLVLGRRLHWKVGRFLALEYAVHVIGGAPVLVERIGTVGHEAAGL